MTTIADIAKAFQSRMLAEPLTCRQFAPEIIVPDGDLANRPLDPDIHPAQRVIVDAFDSGHYRKFVFPKPVQDGGSLVATLPLFKRAIRDGQTILLAYPTMDLAKDFWTTKALPILKGFGGQEPSRGGGSRGGAGRIIQLPGGGKFILRQAGGRGESAQAMIFGDAALFDELDDWPSRERVGKLEGRLSRASDPLLIYVSTIKKDTTEGADRSIILEMWGDSDVTQSQLESPCMNCGAFQIYSHAFLEVEHNAFVCQYCTKLITEQQRLESLRHTKRVDANHAATGFSLTWWTGHSPFPLLTNGQRMPVLHGLCLMLKQAREKVATGQHDTMRTLFRDRFTSVYTADLMEDGTPARITCGYLAARSKVSTYALNLGQEVHDQDGDSIHIAQKPEGVEFLTITQDVQQGGQRAPGRNYFLIQGWASDRQSWDIAWGHLVACSVGRSPSETELHACLERVHSLSSRISKDCSAPLLKRGVDVGDRLPEIRRWLARHPEWLAVRGVEANRKALPGDIQGVVYRRPQDGGWILYEIDVHEMRQRAQNSFLVPPGKPGAAHIPEGLAINSSLIAHYCATALIPDNKSGLRWSDRKEDRKHHGDWQKRHDFLDCRTYGCALAEYQIRDLTRKPPPKRKYGVVGTAFGA